MASDTAEGPPATGYAAPNRRSSRRRRVRRCVVLRPGVPQGQLLDARQLLVGVGGAQASGAGHRLVCWGERTEEVPTGHADPAGRRRDHDLGDPPLRVDLVNDRRTADPGVVAGEAAHRLSRDVGEGVEHRHRHAPIVPHGYDNFAVRGIGRRWCVVGRFGMTTETPLVDICVIRGLTHTSAPLARAANVSTAVHPRPPPSTPVHSYVGRGAGTLT